MTPQSKRRHARRLFISYSRSGAQAHAVGLYQSLVSVLGKKRVFLDVGRDAMEAGKSESGRKMALECRTRNSLARLDGRQTGYAERQSWGLSLDVDVRCHVFNEAIHCVAALIVSEGDVDASIRLQIDGDLPEVMVPVLEPEVESGPLPCRATALIRGMERAHLLLRPATSDCAQLA